MGSRTGWVATGPNLISRLYWKIPTPNMRKRHRTMFTAVATRNALGMAPDVGNAGDCNWVIVTQLLGEVRCSLSLGHDGDHRFVPAPGRSRRSPSPEQLTRVA